jgi:hypothetical protein
VLTFVALAVVRVDVRHTVTIVVDAVSRCAVAIIVDNGKTPALRAMAVAPSRRGQQRHRDDVEDACASAAMTPSQRGRLKDRGCVFYLFFFY